MITYFSFLWMLIYFSHLNIQNRYQTCSVASMATSRWSIKKNIVITNLRANAKPLEDIPDTSTFTSTSRKWSKDNATNDRTLLMPDVKSIIHLHFLHRILCTYVGFASLILVAVNCAANRGTPRLIYRFLQFNFK